MKETTGDEYIYMGSDYLIPLLSSKNCTNKPKEVERKDSAYSQVLEDDLKEALHEETSDKYNYWVAVALVGVLVSW